jgi:starch synthase
MGCVPTNNQHPSMERKTVALRILFLAAEVAPFAKAGGLADVAGSLPQALRALGYDVRVVMPYYRAIHTRRFAIRSTGIHFTVHFDGIPHVVRVFATTLPGSSVPVYLLDHPHYEGIGDIYYQEVRNTNEQRVFQRERFLFFSRAIPDLCVALGWYPAILHCHDWHTAAAPLFASLFGEKRLRAAASVYTIHNLPLQGSVPLSRFAEYLGVNARTLRIPQAALQNGTVNLAGLGIATADAITTVSPTYAKEIIRPENGAGLHQILRRRRQRLVGILNGLDVNLYNPARDPAVLPYRCASIEKKNQNTIRLARRLRIAGSRPIVGMVTRLTSQKGISLVCDLVPELVQWGCSLVVLGTGEPPLERRLSALAKRYPKNVSASITFDTVLAQHIYAGSDAFCMPSLFEPCGLGQMIAMRYGTLPIVRSTGGLRDSVKDGVTGFVFRDPTTQSLRGACERMRKTFSNARMWRRMQRKAMAENFSWDAPARHYAALYRSLKHTHEK